MAERKDRLYGMYRCPVCGHRDGAEVGRGDDYGVVACSYCGTPLQVSPRSPDSMRFRVKVAHEHAPHP